MKKYEILFTSMRKIILQVENEEKAEISAQRLKKENEEILMISCFS